MIGDLGMKRPMCQVKGCEKPACMYIQSRFMCGEHAIKFTKFKEEQARKEMEDFEQCLNS
jgi:hypothetical protein